MDTQKYLSYFFPFEKPDFFKNGKDSLWNINGDRTMISLAMTFRKEPEAQVMCFMRNYAERYDWLEQTFQDWSFTFLSSFLFYEEDEEMDEDKGTLSLWNPQPTGRSRPYWMTPSQRNCHPFGIPARFEMSTHKWKVVCEHSFQNVKTPWVEHPL